MTSRPFRLAWLTRGEAQRAHPEHMATNGPDRATRRTPKPSIMSQWGNPELNHVSWSCLNANEISPRPYISPWRSCRCSIYRTGFLWDECVCVCPPVCANNCAWDLVSADCMLLCLCSGPMALGMVAGVAIRVK